MVVEGDQNDELVSKIKPQLVSMRRYSSAYSKHLISSKRFTACLHVVNALIIGASRKTFGEMHAKQTGCSRFGGGMIAVLFKNSCSMHFHPFPPKSFYHTSLPCILILDIVHCKLPHIYFLPSHRYYSDDNQLSLLHSCMDFHPSCLFRLLDK